MTTNRFFIYAFALSVSASFSACNDDDDEDNTKSAFDIHAVDLGLPSGVLWADQNVGANSPYEGGDHFSFGETSPKEVYSFDTYKYGGETSLTKYVKQDQAAGYGKNGFYDDIEVLEKEDDAASKNWGGLWRTPTQEEWEELEKNAQWTWEEREDGVNGYTITGPTGSSIFLPTTGYFYGKELHNPSDYGTYWTATLGEGRDDYAQVYGAYSSGHFIYRYLRDHGYAVRPVKNNE